MLAGDADRERAANVLKDAFTEGRLHLDEYEERVGRAYSARTYEELDLITGDIPRPVQPVVPFQPYPRPYPYAGQPTNGKAVASLLLGLFGGWIPIAGPAAAVVLGHAAKKQIRATGEKGDGQATIGLLLGYLGLIFWGIAFLMGLSGG